ncbi:ABC transporter permease [Acidipropionibacterium virtanenii]|uniref:ABC-2 type transporter domain-containing protein n=1 Tax=Acidipropionibacterium virtanenii TaxID=2057246 RepID=A0A344UTY8_9ACTN|nr:ABC-2 family transporter protein [Acidipropionibacterium virtanenii]AXE38736.1 hypothetical protein JS278_01572 [Acidipropionibacterium virtanenii]
MSPYHPMSPRAVLGSARMAVRTSWAYRIDLASGIAGLLIQVWLLKVVWTTVYGNSTTVRGIDRTQAVSYAVLAACIQTALMPWQFSGLNARVRTGQIGIDMTRPLGLIGQVLAQNAGTLAGRLPITAIGIAWAVVIGALALPPQVGTLGLWILSTLLGVAISLILNLLVSMASFWSLEIGGYMMVYRLGSGLASGALIPLWFMPGPLATILDWLPFRAQMFTPLSIYFGTATGADAWAAIGVQAAWILILAGLLALVWHRAEHKVVVLGG